MIKGYKIRIYPTKEQEKLLWNHIYACRFVWNYMLALQRDSFERNHKYLSRFDMMKHLGEIKGEEHNAWLSFISMDSLKRVCTDLGVAYNRYLLRISNEPKFKTKKRAKNKYPVRIDRFYFCDDSTLHIEKVGKIKYKTDFCFRCGRGASRISNVRVSAIGNKWFVSFALECENQAPKLTNGSMGIDLGVKNLAVVAFGNEQIVFRNINKSKRVKSLHERLRHIQRSISRKYECNKRSAGKYVKTANIIREERKLRKLYNKVSNIRNNYIHQTTHTLISKLPHRVIMEDLNVIGMMKNNHLSKAVGEQCFSEFIRQVKYKCEWNGIEFIQADRFYPSSKTCSCCGAVKPILKLSERTYNCPVCGLSIDRDFNAAINLSRYTTQ